MRHEGTRGIPEGRLFAGVRTPRQEIEEAREARYSLQREEKASAMEAARGAKGAVSTDLPDHHDRHAAGPAPEGQPLRLPPGLLSLPPPASAVFDLLNPVRSRNRHRRDMPGFSGGHRGMFFLDF